MLAPAAGGFVFADLAMMFQTTLWAANYTIVKVALTGMLPLAFNGLRIALSAAIFLGILRALGREITFDRSDLGRMFWLALTGHGIFQLCFAWGIAQTTAANAALILALSPVFVAAISAWRREEHLMWYAWLGLALSFGGVATLVVGGGGSVSLGGPTIVGDLILFVASISWAVYTILTRPMITKYTSLQINAFSLLLATPMILVFAIPDVASQRWDAIQPVHWAAFAYATLGAIVLAYFIYSWAVARLGPSRTSAYYNVSPPIAALIAWSFGGETITPYFLLGAASVVGGLYLIRTGTRDFAAER